MKNKIIISLLVVSFLNYVGCYSYSTITTEEKKKRNPLAGESIRIIQHGETEIECDSCSIVRLDDPSDFVIGIGELYDKGAKMPGRFEGIVERDKIDSSRIVQTDMKKCSIYWLKNNSRVAFNEGYFLDIKPDLGSGYYLGNGLIETNLHKFEDVKEVQIEKINVFTTSLLVVGIIALVVLSAGMAAGYKGIRNIEIDFSQYQYSY